MAGAALVRLLRAQGYAMLVGVGNEEPDLLDAIADDRFVPSARPELVFVFAGKKAGIPGNNRYPADLMIDSLTIATHVIPAAWRHGSTKLLYLASSCTYPKLAAQPLQTRSLWTGALEPTSAAYAVAKLAGMKLCDALRRQHGVRFLSAIAADVYGPGDDFSLEDSHVVGALIRRMDAARRDEAPFVEVWGTGLPRREFIYVDDLADACIFCMRRYEGPDPINLGTGAQTSIAELADVVRDIVGYGGELRFNASRSDGMPFKGLDSGRLLEMGWRPKWTLEAGLQQTYRDFLARTPF